MTDVYERAEEALAALDELEERDREQARRASEPEPQTEAQVLANRLAAARSHWAYFDIRGSR